MPANRAVYSKSRGHQRPPTLLQLCQDLLVRFGPDLPLPATKAKEAVNQSLRSSLAALSASRVNPCRSSSYCLLYACPYSLLPCSCRSAAVSTEVSPPGELFGNYHYYFSFCKGARGTFPP